MVSQHEFKKGAILSLVLSRSPVANSILPLLADDMTLFLIALEILILLRRLIFGGRLIYEGIIYLPNHEVEKGGQIPFESLRPWMKVEVLYVFPFSID